jgi:hypothetical protein
MKVVFFLLGIVILIGVEIARVYYIMPFPGSQVDEVVELAYFIQNYRWIFRIGGMALLAYPAFIFITSTNPYFKWTAASLLAFWVIVFYAFNFRFLADKMFYQPESVVLLQADKNKISPSQLVIGISINGQAKAYPIELIGYHHQVRDTLAGEQVMITYCTVCRTGRVYSPLVDGKVESFRLVGMDHFNALFEDASTHSWWRQVSGEAILGSAKGKKLMTISSEQMTLSAWLGRHPNSYILQPDPNFKEQYKGLEKYDEGTIEGSLERRDSLSWKEKSWVVGVPLGLYAKAYDWNDLISLKTINDKIYDIPILVVIEPDSASFHSWMPIVKTDTLTFVFSDSLKALVDTKFNSVWNWKGECTEGKFVGTKLGAVQSYQEFWHSWKMFHPTTDQYINQTGKK